MALMDSIVSGAETVMGDIHQYTGELIRESVFDVNREHFSGFQWIACLDYKTCLACAALDGKIFERAPDMAPVESSRFNPEFKDFLSSLKEKITEGEYDDLPTSTKKIVEQYLEGWGFEMDGPTFMNTVTKIIREGTMVRHQNIDVLVSNMDRAGLLKDPRILTMYETGTSEGLNDPQIRQKWESITSRTPGIRDNQEMLKKDIKDFNKRIGGVQNRPVYGEIVPRGQDITKSGASKYGGFHMVLDNAVRNRTTITPADSSTMTASFLRKPVVSLLSARTKKQVEDTMIYLVNLYRRSLGETNLGYTETQSWGGISLRKGDIKEIVITQKDYEEMVEKYGERFLKVLNVFDMCKIKWRVER